MAAALLPDALWELIEPLLPLPPLSLAGWCVDLLACPAKKLDAQ
jgi:hypothetical protein